MSEADRAITVVYAGRGPDAARETATQLEGADDRFTVRTVTSPSEGQQLLGELDVDAVVSADQLPERTGLDLLKEVRSDDPCLPVLLYPVAGSERLAADAISAGVTDYLPRDDTEITALADRITEAVERRRRTREASPTEQRHGERRERAVRQSVLRAQQEAVIDGILVVNENNEIVTYNDRFVEMWDIPDEIVELSDHEAALERAREMVANPESFVEEVKHLYDNPTATSRDEVRLTDGRVFERYSAPVIGDDGTQHGRLWTYRDVTERKQRERELERYEAIFQSTDDIVLIVDDQQRVVSVNDTLERQFGIPDEQVLDRPIETLTDEFLIDHETPDELQAALDRVFKCEDDTTRSERVELAVSFPDGEYVFEHQLSPVVTDGEPTEVVVVVRDVTDRKQREQTLRETKNRLDTVVTNVPIVLFALDENGVFTLSEGKGLESLGLEPGEVVGLSVYDFYEDQPDIIEAVETALDGERARHVEHVDGHYYDTVYQPVIEDDDTVSGVIGVAVDITDQREYERQLERQNKRLDEFASVVSHDLRNPLNVAAGRLQLAREECASEHLAQVEQAHRRMETLIDDLLTLARRGSPETDRRSLALSDVVTSCWQTVDTAAADLRIETDRTLEADQGRLKQFFENLIRNAVEHGGEAVTVTVGATPDGFYVEDNGPGIPPEDRDDVFSIGYSTGEAGTGLGLRIVDQIAEAHGWELAVTDGSNGGARFEVTGITDGD